MENDNKTFKVIDDDNIKKWEMTIKLKNYGKLMMMMINLWNRTEQNTELEELYIK